MKVHTIQHRIICIAPRFVAICAALLMGVASSQVSAQSALLNYLSANSQAEYAGSGMRQVNHQGQAYQVVDAGAVKTAADLGSATASVGDLGVQQTSFAPNTSCLSPSCMGGACGMCFGRGNCNYGGCGEPCNPYWYVVGEWLVMDRTGSDRIGYSPQYRIGDWDWKGAPRITVGALPDCVHGFEVTWLGVFDWDRFGARSDPNGALTSIFIPVGDLDGADLTGFENGVFQTQRWEAEYWNIEVNKTLVGWDVAKLLCGVRYAQYDERYTFTSRSNPTLNQTGLMLSDVQNHLFGIQTGMDLLYPVGRFTYVDFRGRAGVYANYAESLVFLQSNNNALITNTDDDTDVAGIFDWSTGLRFQLGDMLAIRGGAEFLWIPGLATAPRQVPQTINRSTGRRVRFGEDVFFFGISVGAELRF